MNAARPMPPIKAAAQSPARRRHVTKCAATAVRASTGCAWTRPDGPPDGKGWAQTRRANVTGWDHRRLACACGLRARWTPIWDRRWLPAERPGALFVHVHDVPPSPDGARRS